MIIVFAFIWTSCSTLISKIITALYVFASPVRAWQSHSTRSPQVQTYLRDDDSVFAMPVGLKQSPFVSPP